MSLALRLKTSRKKHGLSQAELAKQVEVSQPTIANWERGGHIPRPDALSRIASVLGTDPAWLLSGVLPAKHNPAHLHLAKPVRHIAVYDWPSDVADPTEGQAVRFLALAEEADTLFALNAPKQNGHSEGTTLIFAKSSEAPSHLAPTGPHLVRTGGAFKLVDAPSLVDDVFARLVYTIVSH